MRTHSADDLAMSPYRSHRNFSPHTKLSLAINSDASVATAIAEVRSSLELLM
jgi:hypothetical protein